MTQNSKIPVPAKPLCSARQRRKNPRTSRSQRSQNLNATGGAICAVYLAVESPEKDLNKDKDFARSAVEDPFTWRGKTLNVISPSILN